MPLVLTICQNTILLFAHGFDANHMLRNAFEHIVTLSNVNEFIINADTINSCVLVFVDKVRFFQ
jgi:hypothetical protein